MTNVLFHQLSGLVAERLVGCGFHPRPCLTKDCKSGTRCLPAERSVFRVGIGGLGQAMTGGVNDGSNAEDNCHILWNVTIAVTLTLTKMLFLSRGHHLKWVVLNYFVPFLSFFFFFQPPHVKCMRRNCRSSWTSLQQSPRRRWTSQFSPKQTATRTATQTLTSTATRKMVSSDGTLIVTPFFFFFFFLSCFESINNSSVDGIVFSRGHCSPCARARAGPSGREAREKQRENPSDHQNQQQTTSQGETHFCRNCL